VTYGAFGQFVVFTFCWLWFCTIHVGAPLHAPQRHLFCPSTPHNDRAKLIAATRRGGNISKKGPEKGLQNFGAFGGGCFRGAEGVRRGWRVGSLNHVICSLDHVNCSQITSTVHWITSIVHWITSIVHWITYGFTPCGAAAPPWIKRITRSPSAKDDCIVYI
jgi:hypothetical protein